MKKILFSLASLLSFVSIYAQPILHSDSLHTGHSFNLYSLSGVNVANLTPIGANVSWDISTAIATLSGTADFQDMAATPYAVQYPLANFAMKFTFGAVTQYSLFILSASKLDEIANNVGATAVDFIDYRTAIFFPYTYGATNTDSYQKTAQVVKSITNTYTGYGTLITNPTTFPNMVQSTMDDNGTTNASWWNSAPLVPVLQITNGSFTLWQQTAGPNALIEYYSNPAFDLYPNPATSTIQVINKDLISTLEIFNLAGQFQFSTNQSNIDISMLCPVFYLLKATTSRGTTSQRFMKK